MRKNRKRTRPRAFSFLFTIFVFGVIFGWVLSSGYSLCKTFLQIKELISYYADNNHSKDVESNNNKNCFSNNNFIESYI